MYSFVVILASIVHVIECSNSDVYSQYVRTYKKEVFRGLFDHVELPLEGVLPILNRKIFNGRRVSIREHPYVVSIRRNVAHYSTGCILAKNIVLTVAHPLINVSIAELNVVVGENYSDRGATLLTVILVIIHKDFNPSKLENDIALLRTFDDIIYKGSAKSIPLIRDTESINGRKAFVTGWGRCDRTGRELCLPRSTRYHPGEKLDPMLRTINFIIEENATNCHMYKQNDVFLPPSVLCLGVAREINPVASCMAVPGAPLVVAAHLAGILSWGFGCGHARDLPLIYMSIKYYLSYLLWHPAFSGLTYLDLKWSNYCRTLLSREENLSWTSLIADIVLWRPTQNMYIRDYGTQRRLYFKLHKMIRGLVMDAMAKVRAVQHLKEVYYKSNVYQLALETYQAKSTFRKMLIRHNKTKQNMTVQSISDNNYPEYANEYIKTCVDMQHMRTELKNTEKMFQKFDIRIETDRQALHNRKKRYNISRRQNPDAVPWKSTSKDRMKIDMLYNKNVRKRGFYSERMKAINRRELEMRNKGIPTVARPIPRKPSPKWVPG